MKESPKMDALIRVLPTIPEFHVPGCPLYNLLKAITLDEAKGLFGENVPGDTKFGPFGVVHFPYFSMGAITTLNLFEIDEIIIFSFYWQNRNRYKNVLDIGANLGLHSLMLSKCGYTVHSYEPDPVHYKKLKENLVLNGISEANAHNMAVSDKDTKMEFIRVLGNTTGSHLSGSKANPYGNLDKIEVAVKGFNSITRGMDFVKMDIEGHEKIVVTATTADQWKNLDCMLSVHDETNAKVVFEHFKKIGVNIFSQKIGWKRAEKVHDMPLSHHEGSVFITSKKAMPWNE